MPCRCEIGKAMFLGWCTIHCRFVNIYCIVLRSELLEDILHRSSALLLILWAEAQTVCPRLSFKDICMRTALEDKDSLCFWSRGKVCLLLQKIEISPLEAEGWRLYLPLQKIPIPKVQSSSPVTWLTVCLDFTWSSSHWSAETEAQGPSKHSDPLATAVARGSTIIFLSPGVQNPLPVSVTVWQADLQA